MSAQGGPLLSVKGVTLQYKTKEHLVTATYRVSFDVHSSDRFVLLGPSGCGNAASRRCSRPPVVTSPRSKASCASRDNASRDRARTA